MTDLLTKVRKGVYIGMFSCSVMLPYEHAFAYESDVHYGLTKWLAQEAGFAPHEAEAIATGNQRVDSGGPQAIDVVLDYGCALRDPVAAIRVQRAHAPSRNNVPALPAQREVISGGDFAKTEMHKVLQQGKGKEALMLAQFGAAIHGFQDSWSHSGVPSVLDGGRELKCHPELAISHPSGRGGSESHDADITFLYPEETMQMAQASYKSLTEFPAIDGRKRSPKVWGDLDSAVRSFVDARTKSQKRAWFVAQGITEVSFLAGVTLPDGADTIPARAKPALLPELTANTSRQHDVGQETKNFFDELIALWIANDDLDKSITKYLPSAPAGKTSQLLVRLKLLKLRDHGASSVLLHQKAKMTAAELKKAGTLTRDTSAYVHPTSVADAMLPLSTKGPHASPLLPYIIRELPSANKSLPRAIAIMRLNHLPYDSVGLIAEHTASGWKLIDVLVAVDH